MTSKPMHKSHCSCFYRVGELERKIERWGQENESLRTSRGFVASENERLRAALQTIIDMEYGDDPDVPLDTSDMRAVARAVLNT